MRAVTHALTSLYALSYMRSFDSPYLASISHKTAMDNISSELYHQISRIEVSVDSRFCVILRSGSHRLDLRATA